MARILVIEDEPAPRELVKRVLADAGHEVRGAATGREAFAAVRNFTPDLLVADWLLGDETGYEVAVQLRRQLPDVRALFVTGFPPDRISEQARYISPWPVLEKPVDFDVLLAAVERALASLPGAWNPSRSAGAS